MLDTLRCWGLGGAPGLVRETNSETDDRVLEINSCTNFLL